MLIKFVGQLGPHFAPFYMVWQNTVAIKDLRKASLSCLVFQEDAGRTWNRFFYLNAFLRPRLAGRRRQVVRGDGKVFKFFC